MALNGEFDYARAISGNPIDVLSSRGGKLLELVSDNDGIFVRRKYLPKGVAAIESCNRSFSDAWTAYNEMLQGSGLSIVPSALFVNEEGTEPIIVSEYIEDVDAKPVSSLPVEKKVLVAGNLGKLLTAHKWFLPSAQGFQKDAFVAVYGEAQLIDVDPYIKQRYRGLDPRAERTVLEDVQGAFMISGARLLEEWSLSEGERTNMASAFVRTVGEVLNDDSSFTLLERFTTPHMMANGTSYEVARAAFSS